MNRLKQLREERGLLQSDISRLLNVSIPAVGYYENEKRDMSTETIKKLADYFNVSIDYLLGKSDIRNSEELKNIQFANAGGINVDDLDDDEIEEIKRQVEYMRWKKKNGNK